MSENRRIHEAIIRHLEDNDVLGQDAIEQFLYPTFASLPPPSLFKSIDRAVGLVSDAVTGNNDILVWGDYDVDGITATALIVLFFRDLGVEVKYYIPDRLTEGYGLNSSRLTELSESMTEEKLLITVDCGISNRDEVKRAQEVGYKVVVTDHHMVPNLEMEADATINPKLADCGFPYKDLAGVGVAFYLIAAVRAHFLKNNILSSSSIPNLKHFLGLVSIGTIADIVPLTGVNRLLVKGGFEAISSGFIPGIELLFEELGINKARFDSESISYQVAPTINAAGRLGEPMIPLEVLVGRSESTAKNYVERLTHLNKTRKRICEDNLESVLDKISIHSINSDKSIVVYGDFHEGILGIVASRLVDMFSVPALVCCDDASRNGFIKGSGRSPAGFDLYSVLDSCRNVLSSFGGHEFAAGFSLRKENFPLLHDSFIQSATSIFSEKNHNIRRIKENFIELAFSEALNPILLNNLYQLEPSGEGNPKPKFIDRQARFVKYHFFGAKGEHLRGIVRGSYHNIPVVGFNLKTKIKGKDLSAECAVVFTHALQTFNGKTEWKIRINNIW